MTLRRTLPALVLFLSLTMLMACTEAGGPSPSPVAEVPPPSPLPTYFVNVSGLALREGPTISAPQISTLEFNDEVQLLGTSDGWGRVLDMHRNITGWAAMRYLQSSPARRPHFVPRPEAPAPKPPPKPTEAPTPKVM